MTEKITTLSSLAFKFGLIGIIGLLIGLVISMLGYQGYEAEFFSPLNHTLSELGSYGHSSLAVVLNGGLFFGSLSMVMFAFLSMQIIRNGVGLLFLVSLVFVFTSLAAVGLFPLNVYHLHIIALKCFFYSSCASTVLYVLYIVTSEDAQFARWTIVPALLSFACLTAFLFIPHIEFGFNQNVRPFYEEMVIRLPREALWWPALLEWMSVFFVIFWAATLLQPKALSHRTPH